MKFIDKDLSHHILNNYLKIILSKILNSFNNKINQMKFTDKDLSHHILNNYLKIILFKILKINLILIQELINHLQE